MGTREGAYWVAVGGLAFSAPWFGPAFGIQLPLVALALVLVASMACSTGVLLFAFCLLSAYRLPEPSLSLMGSALTIPEGMRLVMAAYFCLHFGRLRRVGTAVWFLALLVSQVPSVLVAIPTSRSLTASLEQLVATGSRAIVIVGTIAWLRQLGPVASSKLRLFFLWISVALGLQALLLKDLQPATALYAPTAEGVVARLGGVAGGFLPAMLIIGVVLGLGRDRKSKGSATVFLGIALIFCVAIIVLTYTRGAYIDLVVCLLCYLFFKSGKAWERAGRFSLGCLALGVVGLVVWLSVPTVAARFRQLSQSSQGNTLDTRQQLWLIALDMVDRHPLVGVGPGAFNLVLGQDYLGELPQVYYEIFYYPEHQLLGLLAETGLLGLFLYLLGLGAILRRLARRLSRGDLHAQEGVGAAVLAVWVGHTLSEVMGTWLSGNEWLSLVAAMAIHLACDKGISQPRSFSSRSGQIAGLRR